MKKQLVFYKGGRLKFVGHLDLMRTLQRAITRAAIPLAYSQGFNPHLQMSFASPLALGWTGEQEVMEIKLEQEMADDAVMNQLNAQLPEGLNIIRCRTIEEGAPSVMAQVQAGLYRIVFASEERTSWPALIDDYMRQESILLQKMGKVRGRKQRVEVDVKPLIFDWQLEDAQTLLLLCACGSEQNLKPDLLVHALYQQMGREELKFEEQITRLELFGKSEFGFQSLSHPGEI